MRVLAKFYQSLLKSESRHFQDYLKLAIKYSPESIEERVQLIGEAERELIQSDDKDNIYGKNHIKIKEHKESQKSYNITKKLQPGGRRANQAAALQWQ